jgi:hypothetical protein
MFRLSGLSCRLHEVEVIGSSTAHLDFDNMRVRVSTLYQHTVSSLLAIRYRESFRTP